jgi:hypothetical protein
VQTRRDGQKIYYSLRSKKLLAACRHMEDLLEELLKLEEEPA